MDDVHALDWESVGTFLTSSVTEPLFPNLRHLHSLRGTERKSLLFLPFPSLISLGIAFSGVKGFKVLQHSLESFSRSSPHIRCLFISLDPSHPVLSSSLSPCICRWRNLQTVECASFILEADALVHLSCMPALTQLGFAVAATLPDAIAPSNLPLHFLNLRTLKLHSEFLDPISWLLSQMRLPVGTDLGVIIQYCPSKLDVSSFLDSVKTSGIAHTIRDLLLEQTIHDAYAAEDPRPVLHVQDLHPCMAFSNLRRISLEIEWDVDMTSSELLTFASTWPHLECLSINGDWGWNTQDGITPDGLVQLLKTCPSLRWITLAMATRGYTEFRQSQAILGLTTLHKLSINVVDSAIEEESVPAITAFLAAIALRVRSNFSFRAWNCLENGRTEDTTSMERWDQAYREADSAVTRLFESFGYRRPLRDW